MTERRDNPGDPTPERTTDQSTQTASGLSADRATDAAELRSPGSEPEGDDLIARNSKDARMTPRRFDSDSDNGEPVMPSDDPSLGTKI
jgi:hypothetical protein